MSWPARSHTLALALAALAAAAAAGAAAGAGFGAPATAHGRGRGAPAGPPASAEPLHEPQGMTTFINDDGSRLVPRGTRATPAWSGEGQFGTSRTAVVSDGGNPTGSGRAIEKRWTAGMPTDAGARPGLLSVWHWSAIDPAFTPAKTLYVRLRVWFSPNWPADNGNLGGMKFFYLKTSRTNANVAWTSRNPDGRLHWASTTRHGQPGNFFFDTWSGRAVLEPSGAWHTVEFLFTMNSAPDVPDGRVRMWTDGQPVGDRDRILFVGPGDDGLAPDFDGIEVYPLRGTVRFNFDRDDQFRLGELYVSGKP